MPFENYEAASAAYEQVIEGVTTLTDLEQLGFNPKRISNSEIWNEIRVQDYLRGQQKDIPSTQLKPQAQACLAANGNAWEFHLDFRSVIGEKSAGDWIKREIGLEVKDRTLGSWLKPWFCYNEQGVVLYKLKDGKPLIDETKVVTDKFAPYRKVLIGAGAVLLLLLF